MCFLEFLWTETGLLLEGGKEGGARSEAYLVSNGLYRKQLLILEHSFGVFYAKPINVGRKT